MKHSAIGPKTTSWQPAHTSAERREKVRKTLFAALFVIALLLLFAGTGAAAENYHSGSYRYTLTAQGHATITDYSGEDVDLIVPDTLDGHTVVAIGSWTFYRCRKLGTLILPDTVERIGDYVFVDCDSLTSVTLPAGLGEIGFYTFDSIPSLERLYIAAENETFETIDGVLFNSASKELICYPQAKAGTSYAVPEGTLTIAPYTFEGCEALTSITLPGGLQSIGIRAFAGCTSLTSISFPSSLQSIGGFAFEDCTSLTSISLPAACSLSAILRLKTVLP